ncbi:ArsR/SmtB family transcription factor [Amycolatopsis silviterrae]|uniref:ArsR/SmtB family transcription factor n=1 Tax=Amycolatopsis silviterrae TaxID=1656914 RepID=A0ABW5H3T3_9PSEU
MPTDQPNIAAIAALIGDPARARVLLALSANDTLPASALAAEAGLSAQATSSHLRKLLDGGLVVVDQVGRWRYYRVAGRDVVAALEALARIAPAQQSRSLRQSNRDRALHFARICYDHLAGRLAVLIVDGLIARQAVTPLPTPAAELGDAVWTSGPSARSVFTELGVAPDFLHGDPPNVPLRPCLDWSVRKPHLAGALGTQLLAAMLERGWLARKSRERTVRLTASGSTALRGALGIEVPERIGG